MVAEKELIAKIKELKQIKPNPDWASLVKSQILAKGDYSIPEKAPSSGKENVLSLFFSKFFFQPRLKPVFAFSLTLFLFLGLFGFAQHTVPGDFLYPLKKITEQGREFFVSRDDLPKVQLEMANKRLEELTQIVKKNEVKKLAPAINEFHANVEKAAKTLANSTSSNPEHIKALVNETQKIKEQKEKVESMGVVLGETKELDSALSQLAEQEIKRFEGQILTDDQEELLKQANKYYKEKNYARALEVILQMSYPQQ